MRVKSKISRFIIHIALLFVVLYTLSPIVWMAITSLKTEKEIYKVPITFFPHQPTLKNYINIFTQLPDFNRYFLNSVLVTLSASIAAVILGAMGGYVLGRFDFKLKTSVLILLLVLLALPYGVYLIPIYIMESNLNLLNTYIGLIIPYSVLNLPWALFVMRASFRAIPRDIEESAIIDGANYYQSFVKIMLPIARQGLLTAFIFVFINIWSELLFVMALTETNDMRTLPFGILLLRDEAQAFAYTTLAPAIIISILPTLFMFIFLQNYFIKGATEGSIK
ncbi:MAG TPA: carbohydrate ABC transporter permease [Candidatus Atribacteria bacterium]|nr:carbohydrate ABC transporter permease [Candidatus Atribacteria bacterium]